MLHGILFVCMVPLAVAGKPTLDYGKPGPHKVVTSQAGPPPRLWRRPKPTPPANPQAFPEGKSEQVDGRGAWTRIF
jgi:hypothetical protein